MIILQKLKKFVVTGISHRFPLVLSVMKILFPILKVLYSFLKPVIMLKRLYHEYNPSRLSDRDFFNTLDLSSERISKVKAAVLKEDYEIAGHFLLEYFRSGGDVKKLIGVSDDDKSIFHERFPESAKKTVEKADRAMERRFEILGKELIFPDERIDWHADSSGKRWIKKYYRTISEKVYSNNFNNEYYIGDIKTVWELNKHAHFTDLGKSYYLTGDEKYANAFFDQISHWIDENPYKIGVNWLENLIVAQRVINWIFTLELCRRASLLTPGMLIQILKSLYQHACYIEEHYEFAPKASNHLIGNVSGLFVLSFCFPEFKKSEKWQSESMNILLEELEKQVYHDGVQYEQSTSYHRYVVEFSLLPAVLLMNNNMKPPDILSRKIEKMINFIMWMTQPNGRVQPISDADGARVWNFNNAHINDHRSCIAFGAVMYKRKDFAFCCDGQYEEVLWMMGRDELKGLEDMDKKPPLHNGTAFTDSGYFVYRTGWGKDATWLFFDCGPIGMGEWPEGINIGVHGHVDLLNFGIFSHGNPVITDIGSYTYTGSKEWHDYFRSTGGHSTAIIDDRDQCDLTHFWGMKLRARPQDAGWDYTDNHAFFTGRHDGYKRIHPSMMHRRSLFFKSGEKLLMIEDHFDGQGVHKCECRLHFYPGYDLTREQQNTVIVRRNSEVVAKIFFINDNGNILLSLGYGDDNPIIGWYSDDYGQRQKTWVITAEIHEEFPAAVYTVMELTPMGKIDMKGDELRRLFAEQRARI
jgi:uncharacterized heparinase superfamily protein